MTKYAQHLLGYFLCVLTSFTLARLRKSDENEILKLAQSSRNRSQNKIFRHFPSIRSLLLIQLKTTLTTWKLKASKSKWIAILHLSMDNFDDAMVRLLKSHDKCDGTIFDEGWRVPLSKKTLYSRNSRFWIKKDSTKNVIKVSRIFATLRFGRFERTFCFIVIRNLLGTHFANSHILYMQTLNR